MFSHPWPRRVRLVSGLVLFAFVAGHLLNLSLGLASIAVVEQGRRLLLAPWQTGLGQALLLATALAHTALGLASLATRRSLAMSRTDWVQLALGLATPPLLLAHVVSLQVLSDVDRAFAGDYRFVLAAYWIAAPRLALQQLLVILVVWAHGAIGLTSVLVLKRGWPRLAPLVIPLLFAVPITALLGFAAAGDEVLSRLPADPERQARFAASLAVLQAHRAWLDGVENLILVGYGAAVLAAVTMLAARVLRRRARRVPVRFEDGRAASGWLGQSVLDVSRSHGIPHAHVCSGRGRCGTCMVLVADTTALDGIGPVEAETLARVHAPADARLACQAHLLGPPLAVRRVYPAYADAAVARREGDLAAVPGDRLAAAR